MELFINRAADFGAQFTEFIWFPVLIWTVMAFLLLFFLPFLNRLHSQHHYHLRFALLISLPLGLLSLLFVDLIGNYLQTSGGAENALKFVYLSAPVEITAVETEQAVSWSLLFYASAGIVFLAGSVLMLCRFIFQWIQIHAVKLNSPLMSIKAVPEVSEENKKLAVSIKHPIKLAFSERNVIPVTFGISKPVVILPLSLKNSPEKLNLALRHELVHITQKDFLSNIVINSIKVLFWYHPLVHLLSSQITDYREMRCDSLVLTDQTISKKAYASLLLELMPMPNFESRLSVNMAQESSNLKKRIHMISQNKQMKPVPKRSSNVLFALLLSCTVIAMACTDIQTDSIFNEEELDLMTDVDRTGERGYHQILIFAGEEGQTDRHQGKLEQLDVLKPEHIESITVIKGEEAINKYGARAENGVIVIKTKNDDDSYHKVLTILGMEISSPPPPPAPGTEQEDFFVVVESMPKLIGGLQSIAQKIRYPEEARNQGIQGRVYVQFIVNEQGDVENPQIIRGIGGGADEEALRVVKQAKFEPGLQRGQPVRVQYSLPIVFRLQGSTNSESSSEQSSFLDQGKSLNTITLTSYGHNPDSGTKIEPQFINEQITIPADHGVLQKELRLKLTDRSNSMIQGMLTDSETGNPVRDANIFIRGTNTGATSDAEGNFSIRNVSPGDELVIRHVGYQTVSASI